MKRISELLITSLLFITLLTMVFVAPCYAKLSGETAIKSTSIVPYLSFNSYSAKCELEVRSNNSSDSISATLKLWRETTLIATWTGSGTGTLSMSETKIVISGYTYKLTADVKINGVAQSTVSVTKYH